MKRHTLATRLWHWLNVLALVVLFMSGLNISNAHPLLYWGKWGFEAKDAWLEVARFPGWATIPGYYSLAAARHWHLLFAWVFALSLLVFMIASLINGHFHRDLVTTRREWRWSAVRADIASHLSFDFHRAGSKFNFLQKLSYGFVIFILLPLMIFTGMALSPAMDANWPWLLDMFGGRQSARSIHFIVAWALLAFSVVHVILVLLSGPLGQMRAMITGGRR
ncbi:cytochrome b/b6 domain-containing protein [Altericroceibacterium xinjiangense]|uniref:cytochrome b/b6 domain-containing protein n=1 Tax=Altericroceibacterium xinjiangense TaxID=762261 RepID=UPI000F7ECA17|nr:cytochrome b/b6 domain-containing protein [Altericroceibacterium xinjiangense]